jgi:hypothetical protein
MKDFTAIRTKFTQKHSTLNINAKALYHKPAKEMTDYDLLAGPSVLNEKKIPS